MATAKSPLTAPPPHSINSTPLADRAYGLSPASLVRSSSHSGSYFPRPQDHDRTLSNTIANSQLTSPYTDGGIIAPVALRPAKFTEEWDASQRGSSIIDGHLPSRMQRSNSFSGSTTGERESIQLPSRGNTLRKKASLRRSTSLKRSSSRRSMKAGSMRSLALQSTTDQDEAHSAFFCPVPTSGNPTDTLSTRFQSWRKILKDLIAYFREIQTHYEHRSKSLLKLANVLNNTATPAGFVASGGLNDALHILRSYNKQAILEANKAREIEEDVILALMGLRSDLQQKIKEIKNLSGDFKNGVDREMDTTRKAVNKLQEVIGQAELDSAMTTGTQDPYLLRLAVDRQLERQIDEENYLHQAYLNLENSGRELEGIIVGEIQKSYNAYAGILKRESEAAFGTIEDLRVGPIAMPKDYEWAAFVHRDDKFVDPEVPIRSAQYIHYPGRDHLACQEMRAGLLERKSKYLKSYTAGWYVLSPTHLHEFKSADKTQAPVMSLFLPEQKLGSHSTEGGSSNKFILKGRQTGSMHRGHTWVFRAESHDTMMAWYEDIRALTEKSPQERSEFVRGHSRSISRSSQRSMSSDGVVNEDDDEPFAMDAAAAAINTPRQDVLPRRPSPGGRFPSDFEVNAQRGLQVVPLSPSTVSSGYADYHDHDVVAAAAALPGSGLDQHMAGGQDPGRIEYGGTDRTPLAEAPARAVMIGHKAQEDGINPYTGEPTWQRSTSNYGGAPPAGVVAGSGIEAAAPPRRLDSPSWGAKATRMHPEPVAYSGGHQPAASSGLPLTYETLPAQQQQEKHANGVVASAVSRPPRPTAGTTRNDSVPTISNLHIPGEFPRTTTMG